MKLIKINILFIRKTGIMDNKENVEIFLMKNKKNSIKTF